MSLGLVVLEKKLFTRTRTPTPQSDDIKKGGKRGFCYLPMKSKGGFCPFIQKKGLVSGGGGDLCPLNVVIQHVKRFK